MKSRMSLGWWLGLVLTWWDAVVCSAQTPGTEQLWLEAKQFWEEDNYANAIQLLEAAVAQYPDDGSFYLGLGAVHHRSGDLDQALRYYLEAYSRTPSSADVYRNLGQLFYDRKWYQDSIQSFEKAIQLDANFLDLVAHPLALAYHYNGQFKEAEKRFRQVQERTAQFHFDFGVTLQRLGKILEANDEYNHALLLRQDFAQAWINIAALHQQFGDVNASIPLYMRAIQLPTAPPALKLMAMTNMGAAYEVYHDVVEAIQWFERALEFWATLQFDSADERKEAQLLLLVHANRARKAACFWGNYLSNFEELLAMVIHDMEQGKSTPFMPFDSLLYPMKSKVRRQIAVVFVKQMQQAQRGAVGVSRVAPTLRKAPSTSHRVRVGYLSYDYTDHPTAHMMEGLFVHHNQSRLDVMAFNYGKDDGSDVGQRIRKTVPRFENLAEKSIEESVQVIRERHVDILIDAQGHTHGSRPGILASRPAPIVVNFLVYPGTLGAEYVDYLISDRHVTPPELAWQYTEKLALLPASYQVNHYTANSLADCTTSKSSQELSFIQGFVFANFNKMSKLEPQVFGLWMAILRRVPGSVLLLLDASKKRTATQQQIRTNLWREAEAQGIHRSRIMFVTRVPKAEHLCRHQHVGLFLDTLLYGAHSTATDALYAGLPVLTLAGEAFASRVGVSLLANARLDHLIVHSAKEYEDLAVRLALNPVLLDRIRSQLRSSIKDTPLLQTATYTRNLETAYEVMYDVKARTNQSLHFLL